MADSLPDFTCGHLTRRRNIHTAAPTTRPTSAEKHKAQRQKKARTPREELRERFAVRWRARPMRRSSSTGSPRPVSSSAGGSPLP
nr:hypothetical protein [Streptomyces sp. MK37H]